MQHSFLQSMKSFTSFGIPNSKHKQITGRTAKSKVLSAFEMFNVFKMFNTYLFFSTLTILYYI